jgi:hypothetical protein
LVLEELVDTTLQVEQELARLRATTVSLSRQLTTLKPLAQITLALVDTELTTMTEPLVLVAQES